MVIWKKRITSTVYVLPVGLTPYTNALFLGYGSVQAQRRVHELVHFTAVHRLTLSKTAKKGSVHWGPLSCEGRTSAVTIEDEATKDKLSVTMAGEEIGTFEACGTVVDLALAKDVAVILPFLP